MSTFVYMTRCDGCGHCVDICPSDIMHIDETIRANIIKTNPCINTDGTVSASVENGLLDII